MRSSRRRLLGLVLATVGSGPLLPSAVAAQSGVEPIRIEGRPRLGEGVESQWAAVWTPRPVHSAPDGYEPQVRADPTGTRMLSMDREQAVEFRWSFGDHPGTISTGERPAITYAYSDDGDYTIRVEAWSDGQLVSWGERAVTVTNRRPSGALVGAIRIDPAGTRFELTADAGDVEGDDLSYAWDFGDGDGLVSEAWRVEHEFPGPGRYEVGVRVTDGDGGERDVTRTVVVAGVEDGQPFAPLEERPTDAATTGIRLTVSGDVDFQFDGRIRPVAGLHFVSRGLHQPCRFLFSAWDDAHLAHFSLIADLEGLVDDGAVYTIRSPNIRFMMEDTEERYRGVRRGLTGGGVIGPDGLGGLVERLFPGVSNLPPEARAAVRAGTGVDPEAVEEGTPVAMPATSPFGIDEREGFADAEGDVGLLFIPHDRAGGRIRVQLQNTDEDSSLRTVRLDGEFSLDLQAAQRDGMVRYGECGSPALEIVDVAPRDGETFVYPRRPNVIVSFSKPYAAETLDTDNFRLTYPAPGNGESVPVPVDVRLFRRGTAAWIEPMDDLMGGVRYTAWVKTGWDGVLDPGGNEILDEDGDGWHTWSFWTRPDFVPDETSAPGTSNLSCHVFQTVRDAPLIPFKPAVARIYADWRPHPGVDPGAQLEEFTARVSLMTALGEWVGTDATFVRPDRWDARGLDRAAAQHTAQVYFTPSDDMAEWVRVRVEYPADDGEEAPGAAWTSCAMPRWEHRPEVRVEWFLLDVNQWRDVDIESEVRPRVETLMGRVQEFAEALFPVASVEASFGGVMPWPVENLGDHFADWDPMGNCITACAEAIATYWEERPTLAAVTSASPLHDAFSLDPDVTMRLVLIPARADVPGRDDIRGGGTEREVGEPGGRPALISFAVEEDPRFDARMVEGIVHEMGHALWLEHLPYIVDEFQQGEAARVRNAAWADGDVIRYPGIEGFLLAPGGGRGWNKSSTEGNGESEHMVPLMYPGTVPMKDAFIARHQYLKMMEEIERRGGMPGGG